MTPPTTCPLCGAEMEHAYAFDDFSCTECSLSGDADVMLQIRALKQPQESVRDAIAETIEEARAELAMLAAKIVGNRHG